MDVDFWAARVHSDKNIQPTRLINSGNHGAVEEEGEDEVRAWFPCPFCYVEIEVPVLCIHLQEEHCFDLKNAVCPICAANLGKDPLSHFTVQHMQSIKRRKKSQKSGFWSNVSPNIVKDLRELSSFLGTSSATSSSEPAHDPLLSPFLCNVPLSAFKGSQKDIAATSDTIRYLIANRFTCDLANRFCFAAPTKPCQVKSMNKNTRKKTFALHSSRSWLHLPFDRNFSVPFVPSGSVQRSRLQKI